MDLFLLFLSATLVFGGVAVFVGDRVLEVIAAICGVITGVIGFTRL